MKSRWLHHDRHKDRLLIFCNGWGMDERPFLPLQAHSVNVLMLCDYRDLKLSRDIGSIMDGHREVSLLAWSMGVWAAQSLFSRLAKRFTKAIAVNGTLCPINGRFGIPDDVFKGTLDHFSAATRLKFYRRMCRKRDVLERFLENQPNRDVDEQQQELRYLMEHVDCKTCEDSIYTDIVIADNDLIMPTDNQRRFWQTKDVCLVDGTHFLFYGWNSWDDLLQDPGKPREAANRLR